MDSLSRNSRRSQNPPQDKHKLRPVKATAARTLALDIGGTGIKMIVLDGKGKPINPRARELTPRPATPKAVLGLIAKMLATQPKFDRVSVGFPGIVVKGVTLSAPNLEARQWRNYNLRVAIEKLTKTPVRVINDADLQGYGVIEGRGVELVLTLGTGVGSALFVNGHLVPNLELGHHPFKKGQTYEDRICDAEFKRLGKKHWSKRVREMVDQIGPIFNYDRLHIGGGNAEHIKATLPKNVRIFTNVDGMTGGTRLWDDEG